jgi:hypothetical protein
VKVIAGILANQFETWRIPEFIAANLNPYRILIKGLIACH